MKTISLRTLLREPVKVKHLTRAGQAVQVTDHGQPLWILQPAGAAAAHTEQRRHDLEAELAVILREPPSSLPLSKIVLESRR